MAKALFKRSQCMVKKEMVKAARPLTLHKHYPSPCRNNLSDLQCLHVMLGVPAYKKRTFYVKPTKLYLPSINLDYDYKFYKLL
jgi:hypothetical protein